MGTHGYRPPLNCNFPFYVVGNILNVTYDTEIGGLFLKMGLHKGHGRGRLSYSYLESNTHKSLSVNDLVTVIHVKVFLQDLHLLS